MEIEVLEAKRVEKEAEEGTGPTGQKKDDGGGGADTETYMIFPPFFNEKLEAVDPDQLQKFALTELKNTLLADLVVDALSFEEHYNSQKFWFCDLCRSYFSDGDYLTMHLKVEHFPSIGKCQSWPSLLHQDQGFVWGSICKMVWKPIHVEEALRKFYILCLDANLGAAEISPADGELQWPRSDDDSERSELLSELGKELNAMASDENGLSFLSSGPLRHLISVASRHILISLPPMDLVLDFTRQLASSPLSFCFLEKESLCRFVEVVKTMRQIVKDATSVSVNMSGGDSTNYRNFVRPRTTLIFLEPANCQDQLSGQKPSDIPLTGPLQLSSGSPKIFTQIAKISDNCCHSIEIVGETISCFDESEEFKFVPKEDYDSIVGKWTALLLRERSDFDNKQLLDRFFTKLGRTKQYLYEADVRRLKVVESLCRLQSLEFEARRLCSFHFRSYIVPLMQRFLQRCSSSSSKEEKFAAWFDNSDSSSCNFSGFGSSNNSSSRSSSRSLSSSSLGGSCSRSSLRGSGSTCSSGGTFSEQTPLSATFKHMNMDYTPNTFLPVAGCGALETVKPGLFICMYISDLMQEVESEGMYIEEAVSDAIVYIRLHKTWCYWYCYSCLKIFPDRESHMKHMDNEHKLNLPCYEQSRLVPRLPSKHEVDRLLGLEWIGDHTEKYAMLNRMKELLYAVLEDKAVFFSGSSHLVHIAEFARDEFFRTVSSDEKKFVVAREIDETAQLVFSMYNTPCLLCVEKFLKNLCKQCTSFEMQTHESNYFPPVASSGISYAGRKLQVDVAKFAEAYSQAKKEAEEEEEIPFTSRYKTYLKIENYLLDELKSLGVHFFDKRELLGKLDVVFALDRMLMRESDCAGTLRRRYEKLDSTYPAAKGNFQHQLISRLLRKTSSLSIEEALRNEKDKLLSKLGFLDINIMQVLARINKLRREISDVCFWDYSSEILPVIGQFLKPRIRLDGDLMSWAINTLQELLGSIDHYDLSVTSVSIGEVFVNLRDKWGLCFVYNRMRLNFEELQGKRTDGYVDFEGLSNWVDVKNEDMKIEAAIIEQSTELSPELAASLSEAVCAKLLKFQELFIEKSLPSYCLENEQSEALDYFWLDERSWQKKHFNEIEEEESEIEEEESEIEE